MYHRFLLIMWMFLLESQLDLYQAMEDTSIQEINISEKYMKMLTSKFYFTKFKITELNKQTLGFL